MPERKKTTRRKSTARRKTTRRRKSTVRRSEVPEKFPVKVLVALGEGNDVSDYRGKIFDSKQQAEKWITDEATKDYGFSRSEDLSDFVHAFVIDRHGDMHCVETINTGVKLEVPSRVSLLAGKETLLDLEAWEKS